MSNTDNRDEATGKEHARKKSNAPSTAGKINISRRDLLGSTSLIAVSAVASTALPSTAASQDANNATVLPKSEPPFEGKIGRTVKD